MPDNPLLDVQTWLYHLGDINTDEAADVASGAYDLVVLEYARYDAEETPYTASDLDAMRGSDDTLIVSYLSIGEAESYRFYWNTPEFQAIVDTVVGLENPEWEENFKVRYWDEDWQAVVFNYVDRIIEAGFNGVYLDIIDAFEYWEAEDPNSGIDYRQEMADFVAAIRSHAKTRLDELGDTRAFVIIGQNGEELLQNQTYLDAIDGVGKEDLQFYFEFTNPSDFHVNSAEDVSWSMDLLQLALDAGKQVMVIEYLNDARQALHSETLSELTDMLWLQGIPLYVSEDRLLNSITEQPDSNQFVRLSEGTDAGEILRGTTYGDVIAAGGGDDQIWASPGDRSADTFIGGSGNDIIGGGAGDDLVIGGAASDGTDHQLLTTNEDTAGDGSDILYGGSGDDTLLGGSWLDGAIRDDGAFNRGEAISDGLEANAIWAGTGNDLIYGAAGNDTLGGGTGNDEIIAGGGADVLYGGRGDGGTVGPNDTLSGGNGDDTVFGSGGDDLIDGGDGDDLVFGGTGDDSTTGGAGDDTLWAGSGNDLLTGGTGEDQFAFGANAGNDTINDFEIAHDTLFFGASIVGIDSVDDVIAAATATTQAGNLGVLIDLGDGNSLFLVGLTLGDLSALNYNL